MENTKVEVYEDVDLTIAVTSTEQSNPKATARIGIIAVTTPVNVGVLAVGTVTLDLKAPSGGTVISLASTNTAVATVPASVTVPQFCTQQRFLITPVGQGTTTITGTSLNSAALDVDPLCTP
jgi:hypothetical protein